MASFWISCAKYAPFCTAHFSLAPRFFSANCQMSHSPYTRVSQARPCLKSESIMGRVAIPHPAAAGTAPRIFDNAVARELPLGLMSQGLAMGAWSAVAAQMGPSLSGPAAGRIRNRRLSPLIHRRLGFTWTQIHAVDTVEAEGLSPGSVDGGADPLRRLISTPR